MQFGQRVADCFQTSKKNPEGKLNFGYSEYNAIETPFHTMLQFAKQYRKKGWFLRVMNRELMNL